MNKTYNLVWSAVRGAFIVTHERAKSKGKPSSTRRGLGVTGLVLGLMGVLGGAGQAIAAPPTPAIPAPNALPTGGQVAAGSASIAQNANRMDVTQTSQNAVLNWQSFNIGSAAQVNFAQPNASAVALNRVLSSDPSAIYGKLSANGQVFLVNQAGVLFGSGSRVDVGGLVASTMDVSDADFMNGRYAFGIGPRSIQNGSVLNEGSITTTQGGYVALLAPEVRNEGIITASLGSVLLAGAEAVTLSHDSTGLHYAVDKGAVQALVDNRGLVQADGGQVILSARAANTLASAVINNSGTMEAKGLVSKGGKIMLEADSITLANGSLLDASGATGGGTVLVGGDWQGSGAMHQATTVTMETGAKIVASATQSGDGGKVVLWSDIHNKDSQTTANGVILAKGGAESGNGGQVETSAATVGIGPSAEFNTLAAKGKTGLWLIDPYDYTIDATAALNIASGLRTSNVAITTASHAASYGSNGNSGSTGNIAVNSAISAVGLNAITVANGGSGYGSAPTVTISGGGGTGAMATAIISGGVVTGISITNSGSGYTSAPTISFSSGSASATATLMANPYSTNLSLTAAGKIAVSAPVTVGSFTLNGSGAGNNTVGIELASTITTIGAQTYTGAVTLAGNTTLNSSTGGVTFNNYLDSLAGAVLLTGVGNWLIPTNITTVTAWAVGAGGGGGGANGDPQSGGGGGAGGVAYGTLTTTPGQSISYGVGSGGVGGIGSNNGVGAATGGTTTLTYNSTTFTAYGGGGGSPGTGGSNGTGGTAVISGSGASSTGTAAGGQGNTKGGDSGAGGGGGIGGAATPASRGTDGSNGAVGNDVGGLNAALALVSPANSQNTIGTGAGAGHVTSSAQNDHGGSATGFGSGGGGASWYGGLGGNGRYGGGGGGGAGYGVFDGGIGGSGVVVFKYSSSASNLVINAGTGDVKFLDKVGFSANPSGISITTTGNISFSNTLNTGALSTNAGTSTSFAGAVKTGGAINLTGNAITVNGVMDATAGNITINTDALTFGASGRLQSTGTLAVAPKTVTNSIGLGGAAGTLQLGAGYFSTNFVNGFSDITIGSGTTSGKITSAAITANDHLTLQNTTGGIELTGLVNASTNNLTLNSSGAITDTGSGYISATGLTLLGGGTVTLDSTGNAITTLAANTGRLTFLESNGFTVGTLGSTVGVSSTGQIDLATRSGDLAITQNISTSDTSSSAIVLNAGKDTSVGTTSGGNVTRSGSQTVTTGSGGRATLFTGSVSGSTNITSLVGLGSGNFRYNSDEASSGYDTVGAALGSGTYALYRERPNVSFTVANASMVYGDATPALPLTVSSGVNGDTVAQIFKTSPTLTIGGSKSSSGNWLVGGHSLSAAGGTDRLGYNLGTITGLGTLTVTKRTVTLNGSNMTKVYDGTTAMTGGATGFGALGNLMSGDTVSVTGGAVWSAAGAGSRNVNQGTTAITGTDSGNYLLNFVAGTGTITKAPLTMTALGASKLIGQADPTFAYTYSGFVNGENATTASIAGASVSRTGSDAAAGTYNGVLVPTFSTNANYQLSAVNGNFTITPAGKLLITLGSSTKTYGDVLPTLTAASAQYVTETTPGTYVTTNVTLSGAGGAYTFNDNLGTTGSFNVVTGATSASPVGNYAVTLSNFSQTGSNFSTQATQNANLAITQRQITMSDGTVDKVYDGTSSASGSIIVSNKVGSDNVALSGTGTYSDKNVGSGNKGYSLTNLSLTGLMSSNYFLASSSYTGTSGTVTARPVTWSVDNASTTYGTIAVAGEGRLYNTIGGDTITPTVTVYQTGTSTVVTPALRTAAGSYDQKVSALTGADAGNYSLGSGATGTLTINQKAIVFSAPAISKTYDGDATYTTTAQNRNDVSAAAGVVTGDTLTGLNLAFNNKNAGTNKPVTTSGATFNGSEGSNYAISYQPANVGTIDPLTISISGAPTVANKTYDGLTDAAVSGGTLSGVLGADTVNVNLVKTGTFVDANAGTGKMVDLVYGLSGSESGNYVLSSTTGSTTANIAKANLTMTANNDAKLYLESEPTFTASYSGFVNGETDGVLSNVSITRSNAGTETATTYNGVLVPSATSDNYNISVNNGNFTIVPAGSLLLQIGNKSKVYGDAIPDFSSGMVYSARYLTGGSVVQYVPITATGGNGYSGDDGNGTTFTFAVGTSATATSNVGVYAITSTAFNQVGTNFTSQVTQDGALSITQRAVSVNAGGVSKTYDGSTSMSGLTLTVGNKVGADDVTLTGAGVYLDKNVGTGKSYAVSSIALGGTAAGNYYLAGYTYSGTDGVINTKTLNVSYTGVNKVYDGSTLTSVITSDDRVSGDVLDIQRNAAFQDKNVANSKPVDVTGVYLSGTDSDNYSVGATGSTTANITARTLNVNYYGESKTYDGTTAATFTTSDDRVNGDTFTLSGAGAFDTKNAGSNKTITISGVTLSTGDSGNYSVATTGSTSANIGQLGLTVAASTFNRIYDGATATSATANVGTLASGDSVNAAAVVSFLDKNVGSSKTLRAAGLTIKDGSNADMTGNYAISYLDDNTGAIAAKALTISGLSSANKVYDGLTTAVVNGTAALQSSISAGSGTSNDGKAYTGDAVSLSGAAVGNFNDKDVLDANTVAFTGITLTGAEAGNYTLTQHANEAHTISTKALTISGLTSANKVYDGLTSAVVNGSAALQSSIAAGSGTSSDGKAYSGDTVSLTGTAVGNFNDKDVLDANTVAFTGITLTGAEAGNYTLTQHANEAHTISTKALTISGISSANKTYDGNNTATVSGSAALQTFEAAGAGNTADGKAYTGDTVSLTGSAVGTFNSKDVATANTVSFSGISLTGASASNYSLTPHASASYSITTRTVGLSASKTYDGNVNLGVVTVTTGVAGEALNFSGATAHSKDVGPGNYLDAITLSSSTGDVANYALPSLTASAGNNAITINAKALTLTGSKTYDGTISLTGFVALGGLVGTETLSITSATVSDAHVTTGNKFVSAITLANGSNGGVPGNYSVPAYSYDATNNHVAINTATLTPTITNTGVSKSYDGAITSGFTPTYSFVGLASGDTAATLTSTGKNYNTKDVSTANQITVSGLVITGITGSNSSAASDYVLAATSKTVAAAITPKTLTVSGLAADPKIYNALTDVTISNWGGVTTGVGSETLVLNHGTASFADKAKANGKTVTAIGYSLADAVDASGGMASNYQLSSTSATTTANITAKTITLAGSSGVNKTYSGTTAMPVGSDGYGSLMGIEGSDVVTVSGAPVFSSANQGARSITQNTVAIAGTDAGNYTLSWSNGSGTINPAPLTVTANADANFVTQAATGVAAYNGVSYNGFVNGETATALGLGGLTITRSSSGPDGNTGGVNTLAGTYSNALVPAGVTANSGNYAISYASGNYTIVPAGQLLVTVQNAAFTYGTAPGYTITSAKYLDGSNVVHTLAAPTASGNTYTYSDGSGGTAVFTLGPQTAQTSTNGALRAGNYTVAATSISETSANFSNTLTVIGALTVNQKPLTATATGVGKTYDGTTAMTNVSLGLTGLETNDVVDVSGNGNFNTKNVGTGKTYTIDSLTLGSTDAANYYLSGGNSLSGNNGAITAKTVNLSAVRVYDGTNTLGANTVTITTGVGSETLTYSGATAHSKNVGTGNYIDGITLLDATDASGGLASNYALPSLTAAGADNTVIFARKALTISGITAADKTYDGSSTAAVSVTGVTASALQTGGMVAGDDITVAATGNFRNATNTADDKNVGVGKTVLLSSSYGGADLGNYTVTDQTTTTASIGRKALTISGITAADKAYDGVAFANVSMAGVTASALQSGGMVSGDDITVAATGNFRNAGNTADDKNVGIGKTVLLSSSYGGADLGNYTVTEQATTTASITRKALTISGITASDKTYDGNTTAAVSVAGVTATALQSGGMVAGDDITVAATGDFRNATNTANDKNVGVGKTVLLTSSYGGADLGNYTVADQATTTASIAQKALIVTSATAANKTYDGTTNATLSLGTLQGLVGVEALTLSGVGNFDNPNVGIGKTVGIQFALADGIGGLASNYSISDATTTANINPVPNVVAPLPPSVPVTPTPLPDLPVPAPALEPPAADPSPAPNPGGSTGPSTGIPGGVGDLPPDLAEPTGGTGTGTVGAPATPTDPAGGPGAGTAGTPTTPSDPTGGTGTGTAGAPATPTDPAGGPGAGTAGTPTTQSNPTGDAGTGTAGAPATPNDPAGGPGTGTAGSPTTPSDPTGGTGTGTAGAPATPTDPAGGSGTGTVGSPTTPSDPTGDPSIGTSSVPVQVTLVSGAEVPLAPAGAQAVSSGDSNSSSIASVGVGADSSGFISVRTFGVTTIPVGSLFSFTLPKDTFKHADPKVNAVLEARSEDGRSIPKWLNFDPGTGRFTGKPPEGLEKFVVVVVARDNTGNEASTKVELTFQR